MKKSYDPKTRDSSWQQVQPGCYIDPAGCGHIFPDEILAFLQAMHPEAGFDPCSRDDYDLVIYTYTRMLQRESPGLEIRIMQHQRKPD